MKTVVAAAVGAFGASWYRHNECDVQALWFSQPKPFSTEAFQSYKLVEVRQESPNSKYFKFALAKDNMQLNLPIASCITLRYTAANGEEVMRPYTPLNLHDDKGSFELVVKCYPNSKMGSHLFGLKVGDTIDAKGPWPTLAITPNQFKRIGMLAGGTGITPMYQVLRNILSVPENRTHISLLYSNHTEDDILLRKELDVIMKANPKTFVVQHTLTTPSKKWTGYSGHINKKMIEETMPSVKEKANSMVLVSGPPAFMKSISGPKDYSSRPPRQGCVDGYLKELGYDESCVYKF